MSQHIAVIDIGKTNKKVAVYNRKLELVDVAKENFDEIAENDIHFENLPEITPWLLARIKEFAAKYDIAAISVTTHGATVVLLDENGELAVPCVAYTTEADAAFSDRFFSDFGDREDLQKETATAEIGSMINPGKLIRFIQETYPDEFKNVRSILNYPQYFGYLLTGKAGAEPTYLGCHSYLFNPKQRTYSSVAEKMGILSMLPERTAKSWDVLGNVSAEMAAKTGLSTDCVVTMGIHDSNASLLPYLVQNHEDFVLNSTGTWCVAMHPANSLDFDDNELGKTVFYNLDVFFNPVKTSIFMGGLEFETYFEILKEKHNLDIDYFGDLSDAIRKVIAEKRCFILPSVTRGVGIFPQSAPCAIEDGNSIALEDIQAGNHPAFFANLEEAGAALILALAFQTKVAMDYVDFDGSGTIYVEGGFRKNANYNGVLGAAFPKATIASTHMAEATSFGAAILAEAALQGGDPNVTKDLFTIEETVIPALDCPGLQDYFDAYLKALQTANA